MEILSKIGSWANKLTEIGISVIALGVVLEVLFGGAGIPFFGNMTVVSNIMGLLGSLSAEGSFLWVFLKSKENPNIYSRTERCGNFYSMIKLKKILKKIDKYIMDALYSMYPNLTKHMKK